MASVAGRHSGKTLCVASSIAGLAGLAIWLIGLSSDAERAMHAYLTAWSFAVFVAVGALVFLAAGHAMNAVWVAIVRRLAHAITGALPLLFVGFLPIVLGADLLYPWVDPSSALDEHAVHKIEHKSPYLNVPHFVFRGVLYLAVWTVASELLRAWSLRRGGQRADGADGGRERRFSCAALPLIGLAVTFAAFDWLMSLDPLWLSTIFGLYVFAGGFVAGIALVALLGWSLSRTGGPLEAALRPSHFHALARLIFAFTIFWAYCGYFQAMLIQSANLPHEVTFYLDRMGGGWKWVTYLLIVGHFAVPFAVLLLRRWKKSPPVVAAVSIWILFMALVDLYWMIVPASDRGPVPGWVEIAAAVGVVAAAVAFAGWRQLSHPLLAHGDPALDRARAYDSDT